MKRTTSRESLDREKLLGSRGQGVEEHPGCEGVGVHIQSSAELFTAAEKVKALEEAGIVVAQSPADMGKAVVEALKRKR